MTRLPAYLTEELEGLNWEMRRGSKHLKLYIEGDFVTVWSSSKSCNNNQMVNTRARIRAWRRRNNCERT